ncbi:TonB-linked outer membrane protein, SusC/RagA family [Chitinophaga jiangningensis]|uniref:TonB-linked outer membrane protein, SusC/RagA family n=1 Tax=Chitinophaga jiangningensis TaxID=1419482 RepID=A0A1M7KBX4_9BACT|nr:SusC/RagA family TonB-linked outer membrane protein [Chitinophaga jiangningensis]SHM62671.1 TonB-linked outer membrane protein, SusC/RagA family [Chitinophaga jiangningensis]
MKSKFLWAFGKSLHSGMPCLLILALLITYIMPANATIVPQEKINISLEKVSIKTVLKTIQQKSHYRLIYSDDILPEKPPVSIHAENATVEQVLAQTFTGTTLRYATMDNNVIIIASRDASAIKISGTVTNERGDLLIGVSVKIKGTNIGTMTNEKGHFELQATAGVTLVFSYVGYEQTEIVSTADPINITLKESASGLNEVVVVGYGTQKKTSSTASVSAVQGKELAKSPVTNISNSLAGNVAGISMRPNGGQPGRDNPDIHIRGIATTGNNSPLIVVDGIIRNNINEISPSSIASVTVLKDAAAVAPYGLGGANGVILITTKRGQSGIPSLSLNAYYGWQTPTYYPKMLNAQDYMRLRNEAYMNENPGGTQQPFADDYINNYAAMNAKDPDKYPISNTKDLVRMQAPIQNYNLQLSGGTKVVRYYAGLGFLNQDGMFAPVNYKRYDYNVNMEVSATPTTLVSMTLIGAIQNTNSVDAATTPGQLFRSAYKLIPITNLYYSNGLWGEFAGNSPVGILNAGYSHRNATSLLTTLAVEQQLPFIKGLSIKGTFSYDPNDVMVKGWHTPFYFYSQNTATTPYTYTKQVSTSEGNAAPYTWLNQEYAKNQFFTYQGFLNYHNTFGKHDITGLLVAEARRNDSTGFSARRNNFAVNIDELGMGSSNKNDFDNNGSTVTGSQLGFVYRLGYIYDHKYLFEAAGRYDGHYYFAPGKRWGYFPAFSAGWIVSEEKFMAGRSSILNYLKLRGSWGKSGNLAGAAFQYLNGYNLYGNAYAFGNGNMVQGSNITLEANANITWEISTKTDVGLDASFWQGLLTLELDYFRERRTGMLLPPAVTVPVEYGLNLSDENQGIMVNHGFEVVAGTNYRFSNGLQFNLSGNFSYAKNKMEQIFETAATRDNPNRSRTGRPFGTQFGYHAQGLFSQADDKNQDGIINGDDGYNVTQFGVLHPGDIRYADISGPDGKPDGKIDANDEVVIGNPVYPFITYGFTPSVSWKGFDLSLFFQGAALSGLNFRGFQTVPFNNNNSNSSYEYFNNHWTPSTPDAKYPRANQSPYANNTQNSDFWIMKTGYLRLKTAVLGYTLPARISKAMKMQRLRCYFSGQNLLTFSKMKFMDPEVGYTDLETAYPNQKVFVFGLNVTF